MKFNVEFTRQEVNFSCTRTSEQTMETHSKSMSMRFLVLLSVSGMVSSNFLKFQFKIWQTFIFCKLALFPNCFFPSTRCIFVCFHDSNNFCSRLTSAISLHAQVQFHAKFPVFDSQSDRGFTLSYAILIGIL